MSSVRDVPIQLVVVVLVVVVSGASVFVVVFVDCHRGQVQGTPLSDR